MRAAVVATVILLIGGLARADELSMADAVRQAREHSPDLVAAEARIAQTDALLDQAWALLIPTLSGVFRYTHFDQEIAIPFGMPGGPTQNIVIQEQNQFDASAKLSVPLLNGRTLPLIKNLYDTFDIRKLSREGLAEQVGHRAARVWLQVVMAQRAVALGKQDVQFYREHLAAANKRKELGAATRIDVLRATAELTRAEGVLGQRTRAVDAAREALAVLLGRRDTSFTVPDAAPPIELPVAPDAPLDALSAMALGNNEDYTSLVMSETIADRSIDEIWTRFLPTITLDGNLNWSQAGGFSGDNTNWNIMVVAAWTAYDGGVRYGMLDEKRAALRETRAQAESMKDGLRSQMVQARAAVTDADAQLVVARKTEALARESLDAVKEAYELGAVDYLVVFDAKNAAEQAELGVLAGEVTAATSRLSLREALSLPAVEP